MIVTELEHAGFKNVILITDRGYESMKNLEVYIAKGAKGYNQRQMWSWGSS